MNRSALLVALALLTSATTGCHRKHKVAKTPADTTAETATPSTADAPVDEPDSGVTCSGMPVIENSYEAFSVAKPKAWRLSYSTGSIFIKKDNAGKEGVLIVPARLKQDVPPEKFLTAFADGLGGAIRKAGGTFSVSKIDHDAKHASAQAKAVVQGTPLEGTITVEKEAGFATLKLPFAPASELATERPTLDKIAGCFHRKTTMLAHSAATPSAGGAPSATATPTTAFKIHQGKFFRVALPADWKVTSEGANGIDLLENDGLAAVGFGYVTGMQGNQTPGQFIQKMTGSYLPDAKVVARTNLPPPGPGWTSVAMEFDAKALKSNAPIHGVATGSVLNQAGSSSGIVATRYATVGAWNAKKSLLQSIAQSIKITNMPASAPRTVIPRGSPGDSPYVASTGAGEPSAAEDQSASLMERWAAQDKQSAAQQQYMMDWDPVHDANGEHYNAPTNAYNADGPQGAGYYLDKGNGNVEKLQSDAE